VITMRDGIVLSDSADPVKGDHSKESE